ncbi:FAS1-like dehydratase domain-containing protein [Sphingopyxis chilensis]|uniref:FAS1-like dehydratase domain-containing protein n=1 Tax=Sphingopyxis chilensis TaxID=180400 RepID=UPI002DDC918C|nr:MaoC family dehydratase N-terminal domain-containing protein [Sphingopyxis chilensis]
MMEEMTTLVTPQMEASKGVWHSFERSFPIAASDIRRWAIAAYWGAMPPRLFWDDDYARTTRWGGIVAPEDFNPFAWQLPRDLTEEELRLQGAIPGEETRQGDNILNGGQADIFGARMRPGDVISSRSRLTHWEEREGRNGLTLYTFNETEWTNQNHELVKSRVLTLIHY